MSDTAATESPAPTTDERPRNGWVPMTLIVVATVVAILSAGTTWVRTQALDTDEWVDASSQILANSDVQAALATYLVDELYVDNEVQNALESALPDELQGLAGPIAGALRSPVTEGVERILNRPRVQQVWEAANRRAHELFVAIVRDEGGENVSSSGGAVVLDLAGMVEEVGADIGLPQSILDRIPDDAGQITIFQSDELADVQDTVRVMDFLSWFLFVVVVILYALAVYFAVDRRRVLRDVGIALAVGGVVLLALRTVAVRVTVDSIVDIPANRSAATYVGDVFTQLLTDMAWTAVIVGLLIAGFAALLGAHRWAVAARGRLAATSRPGAFIAGGAVVLFILLAWWGPGHVFERWVTGLTMLALFVGAVIALTAAVGSSSRPEEIDA
jgi:hypothetical protein